MVLNVLRTHSPTSFIIQPGSMKLFLQPYLHVQIMFTKFCLDIFELKYLGLLLIEVY